MVKILSFGIFLNIFAIARCKIKAPKMKTHVMIPSVRNITHLKWMDSLYFNLLSAYRTAIQCKIMPMHKSSVEPTLETLVKIK